MSQKGFTLIELLVVVAIIGIISSVGIGVYNNYISSAKQFSVKTIHKNTVNFFELKMIECLEKGIITHKKRGSSGILLEIVEKDCKKSNPWNFLMDLGYNNIRHHFSYEQEIECLHENPFFPRPPHPSTGICVNNTQNKINPHWGNGCSNIIGKTNYYGHHSGGVAYWDVWTNLGEECIHDTVRWGQPINLY